MWKALIGLGLALAASPALAKPAGHYPAGAEEPGAQGRANVVFALAQIPTTAGKNAFQRMAACGFVIQGSTSWIARQKADIPQYGTKAGDMTLQVLFNRKAADPALGKDLMARWTIHAGQATPSSGWAKLIQTSPYPMKAEGLKPC